MKIPVFFAKSIGNQKNQFNLLVSHFVGKKYIPNVQVLFYKEGPFTSGSYSVLEIIRDLHL